MTEKKLAAFKISTTQKPSVGRLKTEKAGAKLEPPISQSLGFARLEKVLESQDAASVGQNLDRLIKNLEAFQAQATTPKDKSSAKKAIVAVERVADLLDYLFQTKATLAEAQKT